MIAYAIIQLMAVKAYEMQLYAIQMGLMEVEDLSVDMDDDTNADDSTPLTGAFN